MHAQESLPGVKNYNTKFSKLSPKIDGLIDEAVWQEAEVHSDFVQSSPHPQGKLNQRTEVRFIYDNEAVYVAARMYESDPDSINNFLTERDWFGNADFFIVVFNTYQDGINGEGFAVTPAGVQIDIKYSYGDESSSWNAVWESATTIDEQGWVAEMKIPYSALRFPAVDKQIWGVNFGREIRRKRERSWWNFINPTVDGFLTQTGTLSGIENIEPPVRLFFFPYASSYVESNSASGGGEAYSFNAGMDLKYGLSDAFTLDMTLIPDFGQTRFDNQVLNLSAFEVQFNENRQFFTEGVELFTKADLFYSRRVGGTPLNFSSIEDELSSTEEIEDNPGQSQLINATKISGRNKKGLGIGFFNAVENEEHAEIKDKETGQKRRIKTNPLTNYNVVVLDQVLRNNSFVTFTNTNVTRVGSARDANVSQLDFQLADKKNKYALIGSAGMSHLFEKNKTTDGLNWDLSFEKISGNLTYGLGHEQISDEYNPNDLGFLNINNLKSTSLFGSYANFNPKKFNFWRHELDLGYDQLYQANEFVNFSTSWEMVYGLKSFHAFGLNAGAEPVRSNDFYETRTFEQFYRFPKNFWFGGFFSSDYSRPFAWDIRYQRREFDEAGRYNQSLFLSPRFRPNDQLFFVIGFTKNQNKNEMGFVNASNDSITFGRRLFTEHIGFINGSYIFNNKMALSLNLRHYWSTAVYNRFNLVDNENGALLDTDYQGFNEDGTSIHDRSFNAFNIDLGFSWRFAPGSDINIVWKNIILENGDPLERNYFKDLDYTLGSPQINSLSIKVLYFIDYLSLKKSSKN